MISLISPIFRVLLILAITIAQSCGNEKESDTNTLKPDIKEHPGSEVTVFDKSFKLIDQDTPVEELASGFTWSEGPLWLEDQNMLIFSDVPENVVYAWRTSTGLTEYLRPSGFTGKSTRSGEPGSNGLLLDKDGLLVLCQHGDRRLARMNASLEEPLPAFGSVVDFYDGKRFNSPNDAALFKDGSIYFTDPPYGLKDKDTDQEKQLPFNGVYRWHPDGRVTLLVDSLTRPNGIAFSPDFTRLYVAQSDPKRAVWFEYGLNAEGGITDGGIFFDATDRVGAMKGLPDGMKVHPDGTIFATGPGGVLVFSPDGALLAQIDTGEATANCAFDSKYRYLYMTADAFLLRIALTRE